MNKAAVLDLVPDKEHDTKPSATAVKAQDKGRSMALIRASRDGHEAVSRLLIDKEAEELIWALRMGHEAVARLLIEKGVDVDVRDGSGSTGLILASQGGHEAVARLLIDKGAEVNARNDFGATALIWALRNGHEAVARLLIDKGADVEARDGSGSTGLIWASQGGHEAVARLLIEKGVDVDVRDGSGSTGLILASQGGHEAVARLLIDKGADVEARDGSGSTALIWASQGGHEAVARLLIEKAADILPDHALGLHHSATMVLHPRAHNSASGFKAAPFAKAGVTTEDDFSDMETAPAGGALAKNPTLPTPDPPDSHRRWDLRPENHPSDGADPSPRSYQPHVQPTSENEPPPWPAWDTLQRPRHTNGPCHSTTPPPGEIEQEPMAHVGEARSGDQKASDGDQPDDPPLPTAARRDSTECALDSPREDLSGEEMCIEIESLSISEISEDEFIQAPDPDNATSRFIDAAAHRLLGEYRRAIVFPSAAETATRIISPGTHQGTSQATTSPELSRHPHQHLPGPRCKGKRAKKGQGQDSDDEESQGQQPKKQKINATTEGKPTLLLACPFWKLDSQVHDRCFKLILGNASRVKQHLLRKHSPNFYCQRCHAIFPNEETLGQHIQVQIVTCPHREYSFPQITYQQRLQLSTKSKTDLSEADRWFAIWDIIFPGQPRPSSPYIDAELSEDLCRFREFAESDGPDIMTTEMQRSLQMSEIPAEQTTAILRQVISRCIMLLFERWPAGRPPHPQPGDAAPSSATAMPSESPPAGSSGVQSSSNSIPAMHRETPTSSVVSLDRNAMMPGNAQQEEPFVAVPTCEAQYAELSDGFQIQEEDIRQEPWAWDQFQDIDHSSGDTEWDTEWDAEWGAEWDTRF